MFESVGTSLRLTGASFRLVFEYPVVLLLPLLTVIAVGALIVGPLSWLIWLGENYPDDLWELFKNVYFVSYNAAQSGDWEWAITSGIMTTYVIWAVWMTIALTFVLYFGAVGMHVATTQIREGAPSLGKGFRVATSNLGRIFLLALFNAAILAFVTYLVNFVLRLVPIAGRIIKRGLKLVLTAVSYLMLPIMVYERAGPINAFRSAWSNVKKTWSGILVGTAIVWGSMWVLFNAITNLLLQGVFELKPWTRVIIGVVSWGLLYAVSTSVSSALRAVLYWYATTGEVPAGFDKSDLPTITAPGPITGAAAVAMVAPRMAAPWSVQATKRPQARPIPKSEAPPARKPGPKARQQMACPQCHTVITVKWGESPVCPKCGYGS